MAQWLQALIALLEDGHPFGASPLSVSPAPEDPLPALSFSSTVYTQTRPQAKHPYGDLNVRELRSSHWDWKLEAQVSGSYPEIRAFLSL